MEYLVVGSGSIKKRLEVILAGPIRQGGTRGSCCDSLEAVAARALKGGRAENPSALVPSFSLRRLRKGGGGRSPLLTAAAQPNTTELRGRRLSQHSRLSRSLLVRLRLCRFRFCRIRCRR